MLEVMVTYFLVKSNKLDSERVNFFPLNKISNLAHCSLKSNVHFLLIYTAWLNLCDHMTITLI